MVSPQAKESGLISQDVMEGFHGIPNGQNIKIVPVGCAMGQVDVRVCVTETVYLVDSN
jgi:hypothetical protein